MCSASYQLSEAHSGSHTRGERPAPSTSIRFIKRKRLDEAQLYRGRVLEGTGRQWLVEPQEDPKRLVECTVAGTVVSEDPATPQVVAVGDEVEFVLTDERSPSGYPQGLIVHILQRRTKLARYRRVEGKEQILVSNADQLVILQAIAEPAYNRFLIDRYLIVAELGQLQPVLCVNKIDLGLTPQVRQDLRVYSDTLGIPTIFCSALTGEGIDVLRQILQGKISALSGPSGVGKSTLTNLLLGRAVQQVGPISPKLGQGRHVTTMVRMFPLPEGGYIVDTPGIRELFVRELTRDELERFFPDFQPWQAECLYRPCSHIHEPECAVRAAVADGKIDALRYEHYCRLWRSLPKYQYQWKRRR